MRGRHAYQENIDTSLPQGKRVFAIMASLAELESALIAERVKAGMARARAEGKRIGGRPTPESVKRAIHPRDREGGRRLGGHRGELLEGQAVMKISGNNHDTVITMLYGYSHAVLTRVDSRGSNRSAARSHSNQEEPDMHAITSRIQRNGYRIAFPALASGAAAIVLFVTAVAVVGFDSATKDGISRLDGTAMQVPAQGVAITPRG